jgi:hypothetical protein
MEVKKMHRLRDRLGSSMCHRSFQIAMAMPLVRLVENLPVDGAAWEGNKEYDPCSMDATVTILALE